MSCSADQIKKYIKEAVSNEMALFFRTTAFRYADVFKQADNFLR